MSSNKILDWDGLVRYNELVKAKLDEKVTAEPGKSLVDDELINKLINLDDTNSNTSYYEGTVEGEESHIDVITRVLNGTIQNKDDVFIVKTLISDNKYSHTAYVYNGTDWAAMDGNYNAENVYFDQDIVITKSIGNITVSSSTGQGKIPSAGKNIKQVFEAMFTKEDENLTTKTVKPPSVSFSPETTSGVFEVGEEVDVSWEAIFSPGTYPYGPATTGVTVESWEISDTNGNTATTSSGTFPKITVGDTTVYKITAKAIHTAATTVPLTNLGNPCPSKQIAAGSKSTTSSGISGYRSSFYGVLNTSSAEAPLTPEIIRGLTPFNYNAKITLGGSEGLIRTDSSSKRIVIAIPSSSTRGGLESARSMLGMEADITNSYKLTEKAVKVEGKNGYTAVDYDIYLLESGSFGTQAHKIVLA